MKAVLLLCLVFTSQTLLASNLKMDCYGEMTKDIGKDRAALLCNGIKDAHQISIVKECYETIKENKIEKNRSSILCHGIKSKAEISIVLDCYKSLVGDVAYSRAAVLCSGTKNLEQVEQIKSCYKKSSLTVSRERAATLCSLSPIAATNLTSF